MSGYPYGNQGGGYPPQYGGGNSGYPNNPQGSGFQPPPPGPNYNDNTSCASLYGTPGPYDSFGGNQMPNASYGMGGGSNYPPPPLSQPYGGQMPPPPQPYGGQMPPPMYNQPPQPYGGNK